MNRFPLPLCSFDSEKAVLLTGSARSGTTWLGQLLGASRDHCLVNEPLALKMPGIVKAGFTWRTYKHPARDWPEGEAIFRRYMAGEGLTMKLLLRNGTRVFSCAGVILKCVRANRLLPWFVRHVSPRGTVLLIRHPCAVVSSQMARFQLKDLTWEDDIEYLSARLPHLLPFARGLKTEEERRALTWSLDQHVPLSASPPCPWITVSYEELVLRGAPEVRGLCEQLEIKVTPDVLRKLSQNSWQTQEASVDHSRASVEDRLGVWRQRLRPAQVARILTVVEKCGIRGFSENIIPKIEELRIESPGGGSAESAAE